MFVGHGLLAFAIVAGCAHLLGAARERAVVVGLLAAGFATVPDVDIVHPIVALAAEPGPIAGAPGRFWALSTEAHRTATHSLVVGGLTALGVTAWAARDRWAGSTAPVGVGLAAVATAVFGGMLGGVWLVDGALSATLVGLVVVASLGLARLASRADIRPVVVGSTAAVGLLSHPFGDLVTGQPPPLLYPVGPEVVAGRVPLHPDPTMHLLGAFLLEVATIWCALVVAARLWDVSLSRHVGLRSVGGVGYAGAVLVVPAPVLDAATPFVFSVLAVGLVGTPVRPGRDGAVWQALTTGLTAVTVATVAYGAAYLFV